MKYGALPLRALTRDETELPGVVGSGIRYHSDVER